MKNRTVGGQQSVLLALDTESGKLIESREPQYCGGFTREIDEVGCMRPNVKFRVC